MVKDPELRKTPSDISLCRFDIAVSRPTSGDGERVTDFFECTAWRGTAEAIVKYCKKGHKLCVEGTVQTRTYEDNNGVKRKVYDIAVKDVEFLTPKQETSEITFTKKKTTLEAMDDDEGIPF
jgi:single-strand DNA-binding protein